MRGRRLYREVASKITALIETNEFPADYRLPTEREMAERFGVSRATVRESIVALEAQGKVAVRGGGVFVLGEQSAKFELDESVHPMEILETRMLLEGEIAALAASTIDVEQLQTLSQLLDELAGDGENGCPSRDLDRRFHSIIAEATRNSELKAIIGLIWETQDRMSPMQRASVRLTPQDRLSRHREILDALVRHDSDAARASMRAHFVPLLEALYSTIEEQEMSIIQQQIAAIRERFSVGRLAATCATDAG